MAYFNLCTNIPGHHSEIEHSISDVYTENDIAANLRNVLINLLVDYEMLECDYDGNNYHNKTVDVLVKAAKDGMNTTLLVFETGNITQNLPVLSYERNQRQV